MVEPSRPDRRVGFGGPPRGSSGSPCCSAAETPGPLTPGIRHDAGVDGRPIRIAAGSLFVAAPADVRARVGEHDRLRLQPPDERPDARPVVDLLLSVRAFAVRAVEPHFRERPVPRQELGELIAVQIVVPGRIPVDRAVAIPRREVEPRTQTLGATRVDELANHVTVPVTPRALRDTVRRRLRRPEAETVVMLGRQDCRPRTSGARGGRPLRRVELRRIEDGRILLAIAPLAIAEGVDAEMKKERELVTLPGKLRPRRPRSWRGSAQSGRGSGGSHRPGHEERSSVHRRILTAVIRSPSSRRSTTSIER